MTKCIVVSEYILTSMKDVDFKNILKQFKTLISEGNKVVFLNSESNPDIYDDIKNSLIFFTEEQFKSNLDNLSDPLVIISNKDEFLKLSQSIKSLFITPLWLDCEDGCKKYGILVNTPKQVYQIIKYSNNNNFWHTRNELPDGSLVYTLLDAKFRYFSTSANEKKMIENFRETIHGDEKNNFFKILKYALIAALSNHNDIFDEIDIWSIFPSSTIALDHKMIEFKKSIQFNSITKNTKFSEKEFEENLFIRHTQKEKSDDIPLTVRNTKGSVVNLETIHLNPLFKNDLKGKTVCVIDDFLNHGYSFEAARNILRAAGVKNIILLALGVYQNNYEYQNYKIKGDIFSKNFDISLLNTETIQNSKFKINPQAKVEIETLFSVFNSSW